MSAGIEKSRIISVGTAVPEFAAGQDTILEFMQAAYGQPEASRKLNMLFRHSGIQTRYSVVPDFLNQGSGMLFCRNHENPFLEERISVFRQNALPLALTAIHKSLKNIGTTIADLGITHLITVTCTGLYSPGLDAELIEALDLPGDIFHTSLNFLGCNAAFPALKLADAIIVSDHAAKVLVVCVELCTIHFQPKDNPDNLLSNTIFGDGAAAVVIVSREYAGTKKLSGLQQEGFYSALLPDGKDLMGWNLTSINFEMILDSGIPQFLGKMLETLKERIFNSLSFQFEHIQHWAIHPGGRKILDEIKRQLQLSDHDLRHSYKVLSQYGNMSSPTILFVLSEILENEIHHGDTVFTMGFGPGISIDSALMRYENA